ncbi:hypothetical protein [Agrobacterium rosae]
MSENGDELFAQFGNLTLALQQCRCRSQPILSVEMIGNEFCKQLESSENLWIFHLRGVWVDYTKGSLFPPSAPKTVPQLRSLILDCDSDGLEFDRINLERNQTPCVEFSKTPHRRPYMNKDTKAQRAIEETDKKPVDGQDHPAAGPHAKKHLTDESKTPGTGALADREDESVSPGGG